MWLDVHSRWRLMESIMTEHLPLRMRVLAVDDDEAALDIYVQTLSSKMDESVRTSFLDTTQNESRIESAEGLPSGSPSVLFDVCLSRNGDEAIAAVAQSLNEDRPFVVVFLDVHMPPGPDGVETAEGLRALDPDINIVIVTGYSAIEPIEIARRVPPADKLLYFRKPMAVQEIRHLALSIAAKWRTEKQLHAIRRGLEARVEERTLELAKLNEQLRADIAERERVEEEATQRQQQLVQADKMASLGILVSGVAHEINNPNHLVRMSSSLLEQAWCDAIPVLDQYYEDQGDFLLGGLNYSEMRERIPLLLSRILEGSDRIRYIVEELRDFARQRPPELNQSVDVNEVIRSTVVLLSNMLAKSTKHFSVEYGDSVPRVRGDFRRLEQVVVNLLQNACQALASDDKAISISAGYDEDSHRCVITVTDEGIGIREEDLEKIVDPFFTTKRETGGTGLGLSVSSMIVKEHQGELVFSSIPGETTTARILLPAGDSSTTSSSRIKKDEA